MISPPVYANTTTGSSNVVVTGIPSVPFTSYPLFQNFQNNSINYVPFVQGYPWYGGHIHHSWPFVGLVSSCYGVYFGSQNPFTGFNFQNVGNNLITPFGSYSFSLLGGINNTLVSIIHVSFKNNKP